MRPAPLHCSTHKDTLCLNRLCAGVGLKAPHSNQNKSDRHRQHDVGNFRGVHLCASTKASEVAWQPHVCMSARACQSGRDRANHLVISSTPTDTGTQNGKPCHDSLSAVAKQECRWLACHPSDTKPIPGSILPHFSSSRWRPPCCPEATLKSIVGHSESDHHLTSTKVVRYRRGFGVLRACGSQRVSCDFSIRFCGLQGTSTTSKQQRSRL